MIAFGCRNRHFRTAWSSKGGKAYQLIPTDRFAASTRGALMKPYPVFFSV